MGRGTCQRLYDLVKSGGKEVGAKTDEWGRKTERSYDSSGKVTKEELFWYDRDAEKDKQWVKVKRQRLRKRDPSMGYGEQISWSETFRRHF